jgi:hypothetical protein
MNHWMWLVSLVGILSTAVVFGTDMFFLTIGRAALRMASPSAGTEVMGFFHLFADARMPIWGVSAISSNLLPVALRRSGQRWFYLASLLMLILFVIPTKNTHPEHPWNQQLNTLGGSPTKN